MIFEIAGVFIAFGTSIWVYKDAKKRENTHPILWALGVFILLIIFLPLYLYFRNKEAKENNEAPESSIQPFINSNTEIPDIDIEKKEYSLLGIEGIMKGCRFPVKENIICMGTNPNHCAIVYPKDTKGIAELHCQIVPQTDGFILVSFVENGTRLNNEFLIATKPHKLANGDTFCLANEEIFCFQETLS